MRRVTTSSTGLEHDDNGNVADRTNKLRAGVLGANDGIVSVAGLVLGVAATTVDRAPILTAGLAGLVAGAMSMAVGEYVSVSTQRDTEHALLAKERHELATDPEGEEAELAGLYVQRGLTPELARQVAEQLHAGDRKLEAHAELELGITVGRMVSPWSAAISSFLAFTIGGLLPLIAILATPPSWRSPVTFVAMILALALTGSVSARLGGSEPRRAMLRVVVGGAIAMAITYGIGRLVGTQI
jgi:VIT1/CCC1 family predicted Fe2+/Mn2+ transporter